MNKKTYTEDEVLKLILCAVNFIDENFDNYIGRSDYLQSEFTKYLIDKLKNIKK